MYSRYRSDELRADDPVYTMLCDHFLRSVLRHRRDPTLPHNDAPNFAVQRVQRIHNRRLQNLYLASLDNIAGLCDRNATPIADAHVPTDLRVSSTDGLDLYLNEYQLYHGAPSELVERLLQQGFNPRLGGSNFGALFGIGTYLACNSSKSDIYTTPNDAGERCILVVRACLGETFYVHDEPARDWMQPPDRFDKRGTHNSVVALTLQHGGCVEHREVVVYESPQLLPEYAIWYKHMPGCRCTHCAPPPAP